MLSNINDLSALKSTQSTWVAWENPRMSKFVQKEGGLKEGIPRNRIVLKLETKDGLISSNII